MVPATFVDAYAALILARDNYADLARDFATLATEHLILASELHDLQFRHELACGFLKQALPRVYGAEATIRQLQGLEPWHPDAS